VPATSDVPHVGVLVADDPWVAGRLGALGREPPLRWLSLEQAVEQSAQPVVVVVQLHDDDAVGVAQSARKQWPDALVAGYLAVPDRARWVRAQRVGCDLVVNRGALLPRLREELARAGRRGREFPLVAEADLAGRLGLVTRIADTPVGPVAVYHVGGEVSAVADVCPHAGATLSEGELDQAVLTCPRHGSQFDVTSGERLRGPADTDLATYRVRRAAGQVVMVLEEDES
jgi:nitrite reductase/ring-hydroxylating ferredoxin subunit